MRRALLAAAALLALHAGVARGQTCTTPNSGSSTVRVCSVIATVNDPLGDWVVNKLGTMTISSVATVTLTPPTTTAYDANQQNEATGRTITVVANTPWSVTASPNTAMSPSRWTAANDAVYGAFVPASTTKPSTDFLLSTTLGSGYLPLPANNSGVSTLKSSQPATAGATFSVYFATVWYYEFDPPGTYTLPFVFTLRL